MPPSSIWNPPKSNSYSWRKHFSSLVNYKEVYSKSISFPRLSPMYAGAFVNVTFLPSCSSRLVSKFSLVPRPPCPSMTFSDNLNWAPFSKIGNDFGGSVLHNLAIEARKTIKIHEIVKYSLNFVRFPALIWCIDWLWSIFDPQTVKRHANIAWHFWVKFALIAAGLDRWGNQKPKNFHIKQREPMKNRS